jgi:hypothetical protein
MPSRQRLIPLLALLLGACGYTSQYVPPVDGHARVVWRQGNPVAMVPQTVCRDGAFSAGSVPLPAAVGVARTQVHHAVWVDLPVFVHHHHHHGPPPPVRLASGDPVHRAVPVNASSGSGCCSGGGSSGGGGDELFVVMAVAGLIVMPAIATGLAVTDPEDAEVAAGSIDLVNAYNDLARAPDSLCPAATVKQPESRPIDPPRPPEQAAAPGGPSGEAAPSSKETAAPSNDLAPAAQPAPAYPTPPEVSP